MRDGEVFRASHMARKCGAQMLEREEKAKAQDLRIDYDEPETYFDGLTIPVSS